jgi:hypothetical protein
VIVSESAAEADIIYILRITVCRQIIKKRINNATVVQRLMPVTMVPLLNMESFLLKLKVTTIESPQTLVRAEKWAASYWPEI